MFKKAGSDKKYSWCKHVKEKMHDSGNVTVKQLENSFDFMKPCKINYLSKTAVRFPARKKQIKNQNLLNFLF